MAESTSKAAIELTAIDNASAVLKALKGNAEDVAKSADRISSSWSTGGGPLDGFLKGGALTAIGVLTGLAAGAVGAAAYFYNLARGAAEGQAALKSMSEVTGATVEGLSAIRTVAKISGQDMEGLSGAFTKLAKNISTGGEDVQRGLKAIGLSQKELQGLSTDQQFLKIAAALEGYKDGAEKTALAQILMGKSGAQMLPIMRDLIEAGDLVTKTTAAQAREADDLEKNIKRLTFAKEAWKKVIGTELVPVLGDVVSVMVRLQTETGGLNKVTKELASDGSIKRWGQETALTIAYVIDTGKTAVGVFGTMFQALEVLGAGVVAANAKIAASLAPMNTTLAGLADSTGKAFDAARAKLGKSWDELIGGNHTKTVDALKTQFAESGQAAALAAAHFAKFGDTVGNVKPKIPPIGAAAKETAIPINALGKALDELFNKLNNPDVDSEFIKQQQLLTKAFQVGAISLEKYAIGMANAAMQSKTFRDIGKDIADSLKINEDLLNKNRQAVEDVAQALVTGNESLRNEIAMVGKTTLERARYNLELQRTAELFRINQTLSGEEQSAAVKRLNDLIDQRAELLANKDALEQQQAAWQSLQGVTENFFSDLIQNGRSAFGNLWTTIKKFFADTVAKFATKMVLNVLMDVSSSGGGIGSILGSLLGGGSGGGGGLGGILSSLAGGLLGTGGGIGTAAGVFQSVLAGTESITSALGAAAGALVEGGGLLGSAAGLLASIPVVGWIAGAAALIYSIFGKDEKGIKFDNSLSSVAAPPRNVQRAALGDFAPSGDVTGEMLTAFTPFFNKVKGLDDYIASHLLSTEALASVRGRIQDLTNPRWWNLEDKDAVEKASKFFLQQRYAAAFDDINASVANTIRNFSGTADELIKFIDGYIAMTQLVAAAQASADAVMGETAADVARIIGDSQNDVLAAYRAQTAAADKLAHIAPDSADALNKVVTGMSALRSAAVNLLVQIEQVRTSVSDMFGDTIRNLQMSILSPEDQYAFLQNEANNLLTQALASTDPLQIQNLLSKLNADVGQAMGLLSPEQRAQLVPDQIARLQEINNQISAHLTDIRDTTNDQLALAMKGLNDALPGIVQSMLDAAASQNGAADKMNVAADKLDVIDINLNINGQPAPVTEG